MYQKDGPSRLLTIFRIDALLVEFIASDAFEQGSIALGDMGRI